MGVEFEAAKSQVAKDGRFAGSASIGGGRRSAMPNLHVAVLQQPFVVLLQENRADQPGDAGFVWMLIPCKNALRVWFAGVNSTMQPQPRLGRCL